MNAQIEQLQAAITKHENLISDKQDYIDIKQSEITDKQKLIEAKQAEIDDFEYNISENDYKNIIDESEDTIQVYGLSFSPSRIIYELDYTAFCCMKSDFEAAYDLDNCEEYTDLKEELEELENELTDLEDELTDLEDELTEMESDLSSLQEDLSNLQD